MKCNLEIISKRDLLRVLKERYGAVCEMIGEFNSWRRYSIAEEKVVKKIIEKLELLKSYYLEEMYEIELVLSYEVEEND